MQVNLHPANELAVVRTTLANERTLLSYFRMSLGSFIGGAGLIKFFVHPVYVIIGSILLIISIVWLLVGIRKYLMIKKLIRNIDPEDWLEVEGIIKKERINKGKS